MVPPKDKEAMRVNVKCAWKVSLNFINCVLGQNILAFGLRTPGKAFMRKLLESSQKQHKGLLVLAGGSIHLSLFSGTSCRFDIQRNIFPLIFRASLGPLRTSRVSLQAELWVWGRPAGGWLCISCFLHFPFLRLAAQVQSSENKRLPLIPNQWKSERFLDYG